ncbi:MAG: hypothetical protein V9H69_11710 [Anaerolineae bacterium]
MTDTIAASAPVLRWAAQRAHLSDEELTRRFAKWPLWLNGKAQPTLKQLEDFARLTYTAIGYFFLPQPPTLSLPVRDFRTLQDARLAEPSSELLDTIYLCQQRQDWYRDHARMHGFLTLPFVGSANLQEAPENRSAALARNLGPVRRRAPCIVDLGRRIASVNCPGRGHRHPGDGQQRCWQQQPPQTGCE